MYIHTICQPLSFDFTLDEPYLLYSHDAFDRVKAAAPAERAAIYRDPAFRARFRENLARPKQGILFYGVPFVLDLAGEGWRAALRRDPHLRAGLNICEGKLTHPSVADALGLPCADALQALG